MFGKSEILNTMASSVKVADIAKPFLGTIDSTMPAKDVRGFWEQACDDSHSIDPLDHIVLVKTPEGELGWIGFEDIVNEVSGKTRDLMTRASETLHTDGNRSVLDAAHLYSPRSSYLVLVETDGEVSSWISYQDLMQPPFSLCILARLFAIESRILGVLQKEPKEAFLKLHAKQRKSLFGMMKKSSKAALSGPAENYAGHLLKRAYFSQKIAILEQSGAVVAYVPALGATRSNSHRILDLKKGTAMTVPKVEKRVDHANTVRNAIAHPDDYWKLSSLLPKEDLQDFLRWLDELDRQLTEFDLLGLGLDVCP